MSTRNLLLSACAVAALAAGAKGQEVYQLQAGSFYEFGCHGGCACPILIHAPLTVTFRLTRTTPDPLFEHYLISNVRWTSSGRDMSGSGTYRIGGEVAVQQQMVLDLNIAGTAKHLDSGLVQVQAQWPNITIT